MEELELKNEAVGFTFFPSKFLFQLQTNLSSGLKAKEGIISALQAKIDSLTKESVETRFKHDGKRLFL